MATNDKRVAAWLWPGTKLNYWTSIWLEVEQCTIESCKGSAIPFSIQARSVLWWNGFASHSQHNQQCHRHSYTFSVRKTRVPEPDHRHNNARTTFCLLSCKSEVYILHYTTITCICECELLLNISWMVLIEAWEHYFSYAYTNWYYYTHGCSTARSGHVSRCIPLSAHVPQMGEMPVCCSLWRNEKKNHLYWTSVNSDFIGRFQSLAGLHHINYIILINMNNKLLSITVVCSLSLSVSIKCVIVKFVQNCLFF